MLTTVDLKSGMRVRFIDFGNTETSYRRQLISLGMTCGVHVTILNVAPLGCPIAIDLRGTCIALRKEEARYLQWKE